MTTAALIKELRERNKELVASMEKVHKVLEAILESQESQKELLAAAKTNAHPPMGSGQQKGGR